MERTSVDSLPLEQIIEENQHRLGKPIVGDFRHLCKKKIKQNDCSQ